MPEDNDHTEEQSITSQEPLSASDPEEPAWQHYVSLGSEAYNEANRARTADGKIKVIEIGSAEHSITLVSNIRVDRTTGRPISGHEFDPEAQSLSDLEIQFARYLDETSPDRRLVVAEGFIQPEIFTDRDDAIRKRSDSGLTQWLATRAQAPLITGEPNNTELNEALAGQGIGSEELAVFYIVRNLSAGQIRHTSTRGLGSNIYYSATEAGLDGFHAYTDDEREAIRSGDELNAILQRIEASAESLVSRVNEVVRPELGEDLLKVEGGKIVLNLKSEAIDELEARLIGLVDPTRGGVLNRIGNAVSSARDRFIFRNIIHGYDQGKSPFVVYGGSHIVCIKPAIEAYLGIQKEA